MYGFEEENTWALLIRQLILAGGHCENHVDHLLNVRCSNAAFHAVAKLEYMDRVKLAITLVHEREDSLGVAIAEALKATLERMARLAPRRNLIAHNQFGVRSGAGRAPHDVIQRRESTRQGKIISVKVTEIELDERKERVLRMDEVAKLINVSLPAILHQARLMSKHGRVEPSMYALQTPQLSWDAKWK